MLQPWTAEESTASAYMRSDMAIKVIVELRAKPGMRDELEELLVRHVPDEPVPGYLGSTRYEALDDPDLVVEIAEWESPEVRLEAMKVLVDSPAYTRLPELLAAPFKATIIRELP
jgi:quinol monooxygenase YgiN